MSGIKFFIALILASLCGAFLFNLTVESGVFSDDSAKSHSDKQPSFTRSERIERDTESSAVPKRSLREQREIDKANIADLESRLEQMTNEVDRLNALVETKSVIIEELTAELKVGLTEYAKSHMEKQLEEKLKTQLVELPGATSPEGIKKLIETERRDEQWAYDVETQLADFIQMSEASGELTVEEINCRSQSCKFSFTHDDSFVGWDQFKGALDAQEWWTFKTTIVFKTSNNIEVLVTNTNPK